MRRKNYFVYILASHSGTLYTGMTGNLQQRVFDHKFHRNEGFTNRYAVVRLVYRESYDYVQKAISREKQIKGWRRSKKVALIESTTPHWLDLAKDWYPWMKEQDDDRGASNPEEHLPRERPSSAQHDNIGDLEIKLKPKTPLSEKP